VAYPFIEAIAVHRLAHELHLRGVPLLPRIMAAKWAHSRTGMDIHPGAHIGTHFFVDHCTGTVIGESAILGNHVVALPGSRALVARSPAAGQALRGQKRHPTLQDGAAILTANATIVGGDTVIGAGSTCWGQRVPHAERAAQQPGADGRCRQRESFEQNRLAARS
jgi:serine O-acetyltransferase